MATEGKQINVDNPYSVLEGKVLGCTHVSF